MGCIAKNGDDVGTSSHLVRNGWPSASLTGVARATAVAGLAALAVWPAWARHLDQMLHTFVVTRLPGLDSYDSLKLAAAVFSAGACARSVYRVMCREGLRAWAVATIVPWAKRLPVVQRELQKASEGVRKDLSATLLKDLTDPRMSLPYAGMDDCELLSLMEQRKALDTKYWQDGKITGAVYSGEQKHMTLVGKVYGMFAFNNPLHASLHPATRQMDAEVVQMVLNMYNADAKCCGAFTTGGTESILLAMKSYRDFARLSRGVTEPNIVVCVTAHAAFDKAGQYFGILVKKACATQDHAIDMRHLRSLIDSNTIAIAGSAPQYPTGTIDPIEEMGRLAISRGIGLHVDCCLGGFLLPFMEKAGFTLPHLFDFRVPGVTTISCDPHKYGFSPKGSSILMFKDPELRHCMYSMVTDWTGGIYATPTMLGSRPGGVVAATWASMMRLGEQGYIETTRQVVQATKAIGQAIQQMDGLVLAGRPDACVVAFATTPESGLNCYSIADCLKEEGGWELATLQNPPAVHLALTLPTSKNAPRFIDDLRTAVSTVRSDTSGKFRGGTAGLYGMAASVPAAFIAESAKVYLDMMLVAASGSA
mmetsp:Transcript_61992/g.103050  ORF Transcript_61992/g.103050 Transcript_61992/m.103050 type:complete len:592 (+) Transcript_61992:2-1777(+)